MSQNPYTYASNNPVNLTDPSGRVVWIPAILLIGAGIGGVANLINYFLETPGCSQTWQGALKAFGIGAVAGFVGTGVTLLVAAVLPPMTPFLAGAIAGGFGGAASTVTMNVLEGRPWSSGIAVGTIAGTISGGVASWYTPIRPGPTPNLSWTRGWPLSNAYVGPKSIDLVLEEIAQDVIGALAAIVSQGSVRESPHHEVPSPPELYWSPAL